MNQHVTSLYLAIANDRAVLFSTNLSKFVENLKKLDPAAKSYAYYYKEFQKRDYLELKTESGVVYFLQKAL